MKNSVKRQVYAFSAAFILFAGFSFSSCVFRDDSKSFMSAMTGADSFIKNGQVNDALKLLKKAEKKAYSAYARLGIYRRYLQLGEIDLAEKTIEKAYKKLSDSLEIQAVYGNYLVKHGKPSAALEVTESLSGTKYGSIRAEAVLSALLNAGDSNQEAALRDEKSPLFGKETSSAYFDIYARTNDARWLRNCALIYLLRGEYAMAASLQPETLEDSEDSLFWAFVQYDFGNYDIASRNLENVKSSLLTSSAVTLASDSYAMLDDYESAEEIRRTFLGQKKSASAVSPSILVNSAIWAYNNEEFARAYELLINAVSDYPDYVPGLLTYGKFAWEDSKPQDMSDLERSLRQTNLRTLRMRRYDDRPKFSLDDVLTRINERLEKEEAPGSPKDKNGDLIVEQLSLLMRDESLPFQKKTAMIWEALEKNQLGVNLYPAHLVQFCTQKLLSFGLTEEARNLFTNFAMEKFNLYAVETAGEAKNEVEIKTDVFGGEKTVRSALVPDDIARLAFGDRAARAADKMEIWEVEYAAYFALLDGNIPAAKRLYEYVNFETGGAKTANAGGDFISVSPLCASSSSANLAMIYSSQGDKKRALSLYTLAAGKTASTKTKSKLLYRIANIQIGLGKKQDAINSASYAVSLDPSNAEARFFLNQNKEKH